MLVNRSHNLLESICGSEFARNPGAYGIELGVVRPWAFIGVWNAPAWRRDFAEKPFARSTTSCAPTRRSLHGHE